MLIKNSENCIFKTKGAWSIRNKFTNSVLSLILIVLALLFTGCAAEAAGTSSGTPPRGEDTGTSVVSEEREDGQAAEDVATTPSKAAESVPTKGRAPFVGRRFQHHVGTHAGIHGSGNRADDAGRSGRTL